MENKNNFLNWELTQLLPEENPYLERHDENYLIVSDGNDSFIHRIDIRYYQRGYGKVARQAWTWEDVRKYLQEKGYFYEIQIELDEEATESWKESEPKTAENVFYYYYTITNLKTAESMVGFDLYSTYEEARECCVRDLLQNDKNII